MKKEFVSKAHTLSLVRNGNFSAGLSHWFGSYLRHKQVLQPSSQTRAPAYAATAAVAHSSHFPDGVPVGINQFIDHPSLFTYPSRRVVNRAEMFIIGESRALCRLLPESTVDGIAVSAGAFQHPFLFSEPGGAVPVRPGSDVYIVNYDKAAYTATYKAGTTLVNYVGSSAPDFSGAITNHLLEVRANGASFIPSVDFSVSVRNTITVTTVAASTKLLALSGDVPDLFSVSRQLDTSLTGVVSGDSVVLDTNLGEYYARVYSVSASGIQIQPVTVAGMEMLPSLPTGAIVRRITVFSTTLVRASVEKALFRYEFTLAYSRDASQSFIPPEVTLQFRNLLYDDVNEEYYFDGIGAAGTTIPRVLSDTQVIGEANDSNSWERLVEHFFVESRKPVEGRLLLTLGAPDVLYSGDSRQVASIRYRENVNPYGPVFVVTVTGPVTGYTNGDKVALLDSVNALAVDNWYNTVIKDTQFTVLFAQGSTITIQHPSLTAAELTAAIGSTDTTYTLNAATHVTYASKILEAGVFSVSDIFLSKDDYSQGFFRYDDPPSGAPQLPLIDSLAANVDLLDNVIPSGVSVLYTGGGACPPGFKRLDGYPSSEVPGVPGYYALPAPIERTYDAQTNRSRLTWDKVTFAAPTATGKTLASLAVTRDVPLALTGAPIEKVTIFPDTPAIQPGMLIGARPVDTAAASRIGDNTNPILSIGSAPKAVLLQQPVGETVLNAPYIETVSAGNAYELWFRLDSLGGTDGNDQIPAKKVIMQRMTYPLQGVSIIPGATTIPNGVRGWEVYIENDLNASPAGTITTLALRVYTGQTRTSGPTYLWESYSGANPQGLSALNLGQWLFLLVQFSAGSSSSTLLTLSLYAANSSTPIIHTTQTISNLSLSDFIDLSGFSNRLTVGRGNSGLANGNAVNALDRGADMAVDLLRVYSSLPYGSQSVSYLFNGGAGRSIIDESVTGVITTELQINEGLGTLLQNTAKNPPIAYGGDSQLVLGPNQAAQWVDGRIRSANSADAYGIFDYSAPYEDKITRHLVTDLSIQIGDQTAVTVLPSARPADDITRSTFGQGFGDISYPYIIKEADYQNGTISNESFRYAFADRPLGPIGAGVAGKQDSVFAYPGTTPSHMEVRLVKLLNNLQVLVDVGEVIRKTDFFGSILVQTTQYVASNTPEVGKAFIQDVEVGDVYYLSWRHGDGDRYGEFFAQVISITPKTVIVGGVSKLTAEVVFGRYDKKPLVFNCNINTFLASSTSRLRPAKLFGVNKQLRTSSTVIDAPGVTMQPLTVDVSGVATKIWSVRIIDYSLSLVVQGDATYSDDLFVEPSGYLRYGDSTELVDYGTSGHSHVVAQKDTSIVVDNLVPAIKFGSAQFNNVPFTPVASQHTHGYLDKYRWPLPPFKLFTVCTKL